ncbi:MAG: SpoIID/LytB domain-containing protein [Candidatus Celaenobacter polaris]|nr:SpoIID/LytB domain-containing protein [Candidatus Celaenobacter polaris]
MKKFWLVLFITFLVSVLNAAEIKDGMLYVDVEIVPNAHTIEFSSPGTIIITEEDSPFQLEFLNTSLSIQIPDGIEIVPFWMVGIKKFVSQKDADIFVLTFPECFSREITAISFDGKHFSVKNEFAVYLSNTFSSYEEAKLNAEIGSWIEEDYEYSYCDLMIYDIEQQKDYYLRAPIRIESSAPITVENVPRSNFWNPVEFVTREYESDLRVIINQIGKMNLIAQSNFENYVAGVIPNEIGTDSPMEAMKAQAIAARSEALFKVLNGVHKDDGFDLCASVHCQVFSGITDINAVTESAVENTRGIVGVYKGNIINAVYSTSCGGRTETSSNAWSGKEVPYLTSIYDGKGSSSYDLTQNYYAEKWIKDPQPVFCNVEDEKSWVRKTYTWEKKYTLSNFQRMMNDKANFGAYVGYEVLKRGESGRIIKMKLKGSHGELLLDNELLIRQTLGGLRSSLFYITKDSEYIRIIGRGSGHGVGMCQIGAINMAKQGYTYEQILKHYFKGIELKKIEY